MIGDEMGEKVVTVGFRAAGKLSTAVLMKIAGISVRGLKYAVGKTPVVKNEQSMQKLSKSNGQITGYEVLKSEIQGFDRYAKKYHFKYSLVKERNDPEHYFFSFNVRDSEKIDAANRDWIKDRVHEHTDFTERIQDAREKAYTVNKAREQEQGKGAKSHEKQHGKTHQKDRGVER